MLRQPLENIQTIVVKIGSMILTADGPQKAQARIERLVHDIIALKKEGLQVIVVSSGAIAHGMQVLDITARPKSMAKLQACAAIGQNRLMQMYEGLFAAQGYHVGQVLLNWDDLRNKQRYLNVRNTIFQLLDYKAVPIINENDSVGFDEIKFGDNDTLGAQIAVLTNADLFVNLTHVPGLFTKNPLKHDDGKHIPLVEHISDAVHQCADASTSAVGVGGMQTKIKAAEIVTTAGGYAMIGDGYHLGLMEVLCKEEAGTVFVAAPARMSARHRWLAFTGHVKGTVVIDTGAEKALLQKGKSLLPAGIRKVFGEFQMGDMLEVKNHQGVVIAKGLSNYPHDTIESMRGYSSSEIEQKLGAKPFDEVIHRDNLVILQRKPA